MYIYKGTIQYNSMLYYVVAIGEGAEDYHLGGMCIRMCVYIYID